MIRAAEAVGPQDQTVSVGLAQTVKAMCRVQNLEVWEEEEIMYLRDRVVVVMAVHQALPVA